MPPNRRSKIPSKKHVKIIDKMNAAAPLLKTSVKAPHIDVSPSLKLPKQLAQMSNKLQSLIDQTIPYYAYRWCFTALLCIAYFVRVFSAKGWYIVTYTLGIYLLNLLLAFLTPKFDPAGEEAANLESEEDGSPVLPTNANDEFRPFIRRLPEFKFWYFSTRAFIIAFCCAWIKAFDIPAFWPILLIYFIILFSITMRRQINHMIKHKYVPWDYGKGSNKVAK